MIIILNIFIFIVMFLAQVTVLPRFDFFGFQLDLVLLFIIIFSIFRRSHEAYIIGFISGFVLDVIFGGPFGLHTITFMLIAFLATYIIADQEDISYARALLFIIISVSLYYLFSWAYIVMQTKDFALQTSLFFGGQILTNLIFCTMVIPLARKLYTWERSYELRHK